jgi:hypothetical protein
VSDGVGLTVVDAVLIVGNPVPAVRVSKTLPANEPWSAEAAAEQGAEVTIVWDSLGTDARIPYEEVSGGAGLYRPLQAPIVREGTTYRLRVRTSGGHVVRARTTTPSRLSVREWVQLNEDLSTRGTLKTYADLGDSVYDAPENRIVYQEGLLEARFERGESAAYQVGLISLDPGSPVVLDADFLSDEDIAELERAVSSPPLDAPDSYVRLPWFAIFFEGRYKIRVCAIDRNWYDLARSAPEFGGAQGNFGGTAGDQADVAIFHVEGGIGLFASGSIDSIGLRVLPRN